MILFDFLQEGFHFVLQTDVSQTPNRELTATQAFKSSVRIAKAGGVRLAIHHRRTIVAVIFLMEC